MKLSASDLDDVIYDRVAEKSLIPFTMDTNDYLSMSPLLDGDLFKQDQPFLIFDAVLSPSYRVGPTVTAPTRYHGSLNISYLTKEPDLFSDKKLLESVGNWFAEQTLEQVRFRTFTPYPVGKANGFTCYDGVVNFDFELYRGGN